MSHDQLDAARHVGDEPADRVVRALGREVWAVNALLRNVHENSEPLPAALPEATIELFREHAALPPWFDEVRVRRAGAWAQAHLPQITLALFCASLPSSYAAARGARVLAATGRMQGNDLDRRVNETAQFVLDVVTENAFGATGCALLSIRKVRLIHAAVRASLRAHSDEVPINQEDLLGTLFAFSVVVVHSLRRLGCAVSAEQAEDFYQLWRTAGMMLGIQEPLLPATFPEASELAIRIAQRQMGPSEHGRALFAALLARMRAHVPFAHAAPGHLVRYLVGDEVAAILGLACPSSFRDALSVMGLLPGLPRALRGAPPPWLIASLSRPLLEAIIATKLDGAAVNFAMPG